jgi:hypothetical protein
MMSMEGTMVLNAELVNEQHSYIGIPLVQMGEGSVQSDVELLGW